jgi:hypothetical protein
MFGLRDLLIRFCISSSNIDSYRFKVSCVLSGTSNQLERKSKVLISLARVFLKAQFLQNNIKVGSISFHISERILNA